MKAQNARRTAYDIVRAVSSGQYLTMALKNIIKLQGERDRAFATALIYATLENIIRIDYIIDRHLRSGKVKPAIRDILRVSVAQMLFFDVPVSAAVNESVHLAKEIGKAENAGFVNGILRGIARDIDCIEYPDSETALYKSIMTGKPEWLIRLWEKQFGKDLTYEIAAFRPKDKYTCIRPNLLKHTKESFARLLERSSVEYKMGDMDDNAFYTKSSAESFMELYNEGVCSFQSESAMFACRRGVAPQQGQRILDACSAPGGKSAYIAELVQDKCEIFSWDIHEHRVDLINAQAKRLDIENIKTSCRDASVQDISYDNYFDVVLLDVPCSGLGQEGKPDAYIHRKETDLKAIYKLQKDILHTCAGYVKQGGALVYSTCTINMDENEYQIKNFLSANTYFAPDNEWAGKSNFRLVHGGVQLFPQTDCFDGFYIARLVRIK